MTGGVLSPVSHVGWAGCVIAMWYMYVESHDKMFCRTSSKDGFLPLFLKLKKMYI